jgi:hypothetical protein
MALSDPVSACVNVDRNFPGGVEVKPCEAVISRRYDRVSSFWGDPVLDGCE